MKVHQQNMFKDLTRITFTSRLVKSCIVVSLLQIRNRPESKKITFSLVKLGIFLAIAIPPMVISTVLAASNGQMDGMMEANFLQQIRKVFIYKCASTNYTSKSPVNKNRTT